MGSYKRPVQSIIFFIEADKNYFLQFAGMGFQESVSGKQGDGRRLVFRKMIDAGADIGEGDGFYVVVDRELEAVTIGVGE